MIRKRSVAVITALFACLFMVAISTGEEENKGNIAYPADKAARTYSAYYFHGNFRCDNCQKIEQYSREAIEKYFAEELKTKQLTFTSINTDLPGNEHYIEDYQLYTRSLVIAEFEDGKQVRWKYLAKVWDYLNDKDAFYEYVKSEIRNYLEQM